MKNAHSVSADNPQTPLIPRALLFGNPSRISARISPNGEYLSWCAPLDGVMNVWVCPSNDPSKAKAITQDKGRGISSAWWSQNGYLIYSQDQGGDENFHLFAVSPSSAQQPIDLTPFAGARASVAAVSTRPGLQDEILVKLNQRDPRYADLYRLHIPSGELVMVETNPGFSNFIVDDHYRANLAVQNEPDGRKTYLRKSGDTWLPWLTLEPQDASTTSVSHFSADGAFVYVLDSRNRDTAALFAYPWPSETADQQKAALLAFDDRADIGGLLVDNFTYEPLAYSIYHERKTRLLLNDKITADVKFLDAQIDGEWSISSRTNSDEIWVIEASSDRLPGAAYLYHRMSSRLEHLFVSRPELLDFHLARMQSTTLRSRDGLELTTYLTLPVGLEDPHQPLKSLAPIPLVLVVHGGPWARDFHGYVAMHQWLANRGYAVMAVNFRGSTGFGKRFITAADGEWGAAMDDDLVDAVDWAIEQGIADPQRVAILGGSYGGYATLWSMTRHPTRYACGVGIVGPSNLETLLETIPPYWESFRAMLHRAIGDPATEEGLRLLKSRSPMHFAGQIARPLMIGQGANDARVKMSESQQMVDALKRNGVPYTYVHFADEGHGFQRPPNRILFNSLVEAFLAQHLGGRVEPAHDHEVLGHTATIERLD
ncbi:S9 family peptidase [Pseudomonas sp. S31]|uniref:S9 family peptidase n=1 Tax=Pseudomonas sp. S31 TaxID=1564473 RepID=UPI001913D6A8|nr:S9 family peptidase [Pseudomonas sp. S31]MBK4999957.1 S9 family peptidase [Pseudomonas sp. S31]